MPDASYQNISLNTQKPRETISERKLFWYKFRQFLVPYLFLTPNLLIFFIFIVIPCFYGLAFSFMDYDGLNPMTFIGVENYSMLFEDEYFFSALIRTLIYVTVTVPLLFVCALGAALILVKEIKFKGAFRAIIYWPAMISYVVIGVSWRWILGDNFGIANYILQIWNLSPVQWLTQDYLANFSVIIVTLWCRIGFFMVIFIGGLQSIPEQYYEASMVDGAEKSTVFWRITFPLLKPTSILVLILATIESFKAYPLIYTLTKGGPGSSTTYLVQHIYEGAFVNNELGYASAMSVALFIILASLTFLQMKITKSEEEE